MKKDHVLEGRYVEVVFTDGKARDKFLQEIANSKDLVGESLILNGVRVGISVRLAEKLGLTMFDDLPRR